MARPDGCGAGAGPDASRPDRPRTRVVDRVDVSGATRSAQLDVDTSDPYFFDHPLDHLPGMLLLSGLLELFRSGPAGGPEDPAFRLAVAVRFPSFSDLAPVRLEGVERPAGDLPGVAGGSRYAVRAWQEGRVVGEGAIGFGPAAPAGEAGPARPADLADFLVPADPALVHRRRWDNVLISGKVASGRTRTVAVRHPPAGHLLAGGPGEPLRAEVLLDAARQFSTLLNHTEYRRPPDSTFVLLGVEAEAPCGPGAELYLRWTYRPAPPGRDRMLFDVVDEPDGASRGWIDIDYLAATPAVYRWLRTRGRSQ